MERGRPHQVVFLNKLLKTVSHNKPEEERENRRQLSEPANEPGLRDHMFSDLVLLLPNQRSYLTEGNRDDKQNVQTAAPGWSRVLKRHS